MLFFPRVLNEKHRSSSSQVPPPKNVHFHKSLWLPFVSDRAVELTCAFTLGFRASSKRRDFHFHKSFWLRNSSGGHEQNKNDVIFTSPRFDV